MPHWSWAYVTFRLGDGLANLLIPLAVVLHYELPLWVLAVTTAMMNLVGVPATFLWGSIMEGTAWRRQLVIVGFLASAAAMAGLAFMPTFPLFLVAAMAYSCFGVATAPAASTLILQSVTRGEWGQATAALGRRTGFAYLTGLAVTTLLGFMSAGPRYSAVFAAATVLSVGAALIASRTLPAWRKPMPHDADYDPRVAQAGQRLFESAVFSPGRMRHVPRWSAVRAGMLRGHRLWPVGFTLTFAGSVCFFTSFPGVLSTHLGLAAGLVLLCQAPSHIVSPLAYPWSGRLGQRTGDVPAVLRGSWLRMAVLPIMMLLIAFAGAGFVPVLLVLHGLMGLSFALIQVNGVVLMARMHPRGRGQGVGTYHAAVGLGTLIGSGLAFLLLRAYDFRVSYVVAIIISFVGGAMLFAASRVPTKPHST